MILISRQIQEDWHTSYGSNKSLKDPMCAFRNEILEEVKISSNLCQHQGKQFVIFSINMC